VCSLTAQREVKAWSYPLLQVTWSRTGFGTRLHSLGAKTEITHNMVKPRVEERLCNNFNDRGAGGGARRGGGQQERPSFMRLAGHVHDI
jgi:hypothetical protein